MLVTVKNSKTLYYKSSHKIIIIPEKKTPQITIDHYYISPTL